MKFILPTWPAAKHVHALTTTREGGVSQPPYDSLNVGIHVEDDLNAVQQNRSLITQHAELPSEPVWLTQLNENKVVQADAPETREADGAYTNKSRIVCCIMTADCLPVFICDQEGTEIAVLHGGWHGLASGVIANGLQFFHAKKQELLVWLGPTISQKHFEVGEEVRDCFLKLDSKLHTEFQPSKPGHFFADLSGIATHLLYEEGITQVFDSKQCTYAHPELFYSYRKDGITGRIANLLWLG
ncbi:MAG: peptidoglycan editing factor PgeF [Pseudomonadota bacterium]|nr:peptidoglycan editing factor PgeF [Gammaproteobacteria bacterium]MBU1628771.1 peptidoglycan editing factor PgeF [Gammaproteobacteria bacterium]MBU1926229.1 peptidoglycan editing factor PgeF [Gammaproteobacteria bacterium]MBU2545611.1 peptidoglycan editing factor PgeF [Gammaproteobacteria bacterium]